MATEKFDGTACLVLAPTEPYPRFYRRLQVKGGKTPPPGWRHWTVAEPNKRGVGIEIASGHGWAPVLDDAASDCWHREAWKRTGTHLPAGTYELVGPRIRKDNPHDLEQHELWRHASKPIEGINSVHRLVGQFTPHGIHQWMEEVLGHLEIEGVVWHHPDGRMAKVKRRDFGLVWPVSRKGQST